MVSTRTKNTPKSTYAERVLGALTQVQKEHRKSTVHLATLRAQVKKNALAKKDKLGPRWTHWVGKAVNKLESEGILEPAAPAGNVALTPNGKKAISIARRSLNLASEGPSADQEGIIWKQVLHRGPKRHLGNDSDDEHTPTKPGSPKKRARLSGTPKGPISRTRNAQLNGMNNSKKQAQVHQLLRGVSPLTDLEDDDEVENTQLRAKLKEREEEITKIRRELAAVRAGDGRRTDNTIRFSTPESTTNFDRDRPSSPTPVAPAISSRNPPSGVFRTQSGSYIPNLSKQPTPAPSSPEREMDVDERGADPDVPLGIGRYENAQSQHVRTQELPTVSYQSPGPDARAAGLGAGDVISRLGQTAPENRQLERDALITSLKSEIEELKARLAEGTSALAKNRQDASTLHKAASDRIEALNSLITDRDATISALQEENRRLSAEVADLQQSWKRSEETVAKTSEQLRAAESSVDALRSEEALTANRLSVLENLNEDLGREQESLKAALEQSKTEAAKIGLVNDQLQNEVKGLTEELGSMTRKKNESRSEIDNLNERLSRASNEARLVREKHVDLENLVSRSRTEVEAQGLLIESLRNELNSKDLRIDGLAVQVREAQGSAEDFSARLGAAQSTISGLAESEKIREAERLAMSTEIAELGAALASAKGDNEGVQARLVSVLVEKEAVRLDLKRKEEELARLAALLDVERQRGLVAEAEIATRVGEIRCLEEELHHVKNSKAVDEATISNLRKSFADLRGEHLKLFEDFENRISSAGAPVRA